MACGGSSSSSRGSSSSGSSPFPPTVSVNPCVAATQAETAEYEPTAEALAYAAAKRQPRVDGDPRWSMLNSLWLHKASGRVAQPLTETSPHSQDVGDVAVLQDPGDVMVAANRFDLQNLNVTFTRSGSSYEVTRTNTGFRSTLGNRITLTDDDTSEFTVPFTFSFYGKNQTQAFLNSDGNITFGESDTASTDRSVSRFLTGPPRVAPFFSDLDPSTGGGQVYLATAADGATITWCNVRAFDATQTVSVQAVLLPDGSVEYHYGSNVSISDAVVGLSPGHTGQFQAVDLSTTGPASSNLAIGERFSAQSEVDLVALAKHFYETHPDNYDQLVVFTNTSVVTGNTFSYESTVANAIQGIGVDIYNSSSDYGSAGRLQSVVVMDRLSKFPDDPTAKVLGENNTLSVIGQEAGHRWLAFLKFKDASGASSKALLGRDMAHWSFFFNSDASVMEGNKIDDLDGGAFKTTDAVKRYSALDQYAMGLLSKSQVPDFFYVESPTNVVPERRRHQRSANRRHVQRHAARPVDRRRGCGDGRAEPDPGDQPEGASAGVYLHAVCRRNRGSDASREGGHHPQGLGQLLRTGDEQAHEGGDLAPVAGASHKLRPSCRSALRDCRPRSTRLYLIQTWNDGGPTPSRRSRNRRLRVRRRTLRDRSVAKFAALRDLHVAAAAPLPADLAANLADGLFIAAHVRLVHNATPDVHL